MLAGMLAHLTPALTVQDLFQSKRPALFSNQVLLTRHSEADFAPQVLGEKEQSHWHIGC